MKKLLLIGPRSNKSDFKDTGGVTVLFELLISELEQKNIDFTVIDTLKANYSNLIYMFFSVIFQLFKQVSKHEHVSLHSTKNSFILFGPFVIIISKLFSKKISIRKFAGELENVYRNGNSLKKFLIRFVLKNSNHVFFETKYLVKYFKPYNINTFWFPNVRNASIVKKNIRSYHKRFIYIGSINKEKGIDDISKIYKDLGESIIFDLYGPIKENNYSMDKFKALGVNYKGVLEANKVLEIMNQYDVLVLPSYKEGYPGVIIEAFALGMPVIATKLQGIMEICENGVNSILIDAGDTDQLFQAITDITQDSYQEMHQNALSSFDSFDSEKQTQLFLNQIGLCQ